MAKINFREVDGVAITPKEFAFVISFMMSNKKIYRGLSQSAMADAIDNLIRANRNGDVMSESQRISTFYNGRFKK